jgi:hypothetical protein
MVLDECMGLLSEEDEYLMLNYFILVKTNITIVFSQILI